MTDQNPAATEEAFDGTGSVFGNDSSEGSPGDPLPGVDMVYDDEGQITFVAQESEPEAEAEPVVADAPQTTENDAAAEYKARLEGLQSKLTPTFQQNAELKRTVTELTQTVNALKQAHEQESAQASAVNLDASIQAGIEKWQETGDAQALADTIKETSLSLAKAQVEEALGPHRADWAEQSNMVRAQKETYEAIGEWGDKINHLAPIVAQIQERRPDLVAKYKLTQLYKIADTMVQRELAARGDTPQAQNQGADTTASSPPQDVDSTPTRSAQDLANKAASLNTETGAAPPVAVRGDEAYSAPSDLDDAVEQAWNQTMTR